MRFASTQVSLEMDSSPGVWSWQSLARLPRLFTQVRGNMRKQAAELFSGRFIWQGQHKRLSHLVLPAKALGHQNQPQRYREG